MCRLIVVMLQMMAACEILTRESPLASASVSCGWSASYHRRSCFTYQKKNVAIVIPLKDACALSFFKGALLNDPKQILQRIGQAQAGRWIKFTSLKEITAMQSILRNYIYKAIEVEESGKKVSFKKASEYAVPKELQARLDAAPEVRAAFEALTPGRRKSYIFHVSGAKQAKTRAARAKRCVPMILSGLGFNERA